MIEIKNLYKRYHNHHGSDWVLKDINLTIPTGVSVGLIGANGAGKSTLLRLVAGMDKPERGEVIRHSRVSWPVGLAGGMQNNMTGRQNAKFVARVQGSTPEEVKRVIKFVEDFAEIGEAFDEPVRTYSSGMRSRVSFGLSLSFDFDIYISDEATAVGDRAFKEKAKALFKSKIGQASLIMVSHSEGILKDLCKSGLYLKEGRAYWYDNINEAIKAYHADIDSGKAVTKPKTPGKPKRFDNLPGNIPEAEKHLQQAKSKLAEAQRALEVAKEKNLLPIYRKHIRDDIPKRQQQITNAQLHLEALKQEQGNAAAE
ncbi:MULTISPECIES: ABC transporter ATP-binding protein [Halomonadaceae]|uniref:ABC transporter ATP-binding protein n=1 Tax=Halomonadaceae TaxID=28256 RepID=UPI000559238B|nr:MULTISPECIES: ABC transporter ATP-binding protein [Halomonas]